MDDAKELRLSRTISGGILGSSCTTEAVLIGVGSILSNPESQSKPSARPIDPERVDNIDKRRFGNLC